MLLVFLVVIAGLFLAAALFVNQDKFGRLPDGARLLRIKESPNYVDGQFRNQVPTTTLQEGVGFWKVMYEFLKPKERLVPAQDLPAVKSDLKSLAGESEAVVWFGHSSFWLRLGGRSILIDPVFSAHASPFPFTTKAFPGTEIFSPDDLPDIDYLFISHDHWDHLDYPTFMALKERIGLIICPLGVGAHLEHWGFPPEKILEGDWGESFEVEPGLNIHLTPARHFSGRGLIRNRSLWAGVVIEGGGRRVFYSGDSGYGPHWAEIGRRFGGFDLAIIENGQYDRNWKDIHLMPEETVQAAQDLRASALMSAHNGKFCIANHSWDDPYLRASSAALARGQKYLTPVIGEIVDFRHLDRPYPQWWLGLN